MLLRRGILCVSACAAMVFCPALGAAVRARACVVQKPTPASYTWNFKQEADQTFRDILTEARAATTTADHVASINQDGLHEFVINSDLLNQLSKPVDEIGADVCRLEAIRRVVEPWQRKTIDNIVDSVTLMADNTQDAIQFMDQNPETLWSPTYEAYLQNVYREGDHLTKSINQALRYSGNPASDDQPGHAVGTHPGE